MDAMGKYDVDRFLTPPDPDLICCICRCVLHKPLESTCQHVFCKVCIQTWLVNHRSCPNCRERLSTSGLKPVLPIVRNMINRMLIKCENMTNGCTKGVNLEQYSNHIKDCDYGLVGCLNSGCTKNILRKDMMKHEKECSYRLMKCKKGCGLPIIVAAMREHSCIQELKNNMQSMEDGFNKRLKEIEDRFYCDWREVEYRVTSIEHELDDGYRNSHGHYEDFRDRYGHSRSSSRSRSRSHSRSYSRSRSHSHSRSQSRGRDHSRSPVIYEDDSDYPSREEDYASRSSSLNRSERGSQRDSYAYSDQDLDDERSYEWTDDLEERERSFNGSNRDSEDLSNDEVRHPAQVPRTVRRTTSSGAQTDEVKTAPATLASTSSNPTSSQPLNITNDPNQTRRRNQNQERREPNTSSSQSQPVLESPESPTYQVNTRQSTPGVVSPLVISRHPSVDTPMSPPVSQQSSAPVNSQGQRAPVRDTAVGSLYGVTVGETDSDDVEWQPHSGNASSDSWSTEDKDDGSGNNSSLEASGNESNGEQPGTSDGRRASAPSTTSQQARSDSTNRPVVDTGQGTTKKITHAMTESDERPRRSRLRRHSPSSSDESSSSSDSEDSSTSSSTCRDGVRRNKRARTK